MNLEKEMGDATLDQTGMLGWEDAIKIVKQYAESKCREQKEIDSKVVYNAKTFLISQEKVEIENTILTAPLATDKSPK